MAIWKKMLVLIPFALVSAAVFAQQGAVELREAEDRAQAAEIHLKEAEEALAAAARRVAELSTKRLPEVIDIERYVRLGDRVMLGITIGAGDDDGPVEGVSVRGVSPGGAAAEAGLRSGDIITAVNDESLTADSDDEANEKLLEFMSGVEEGDVLDVEYLRDGKQASVEVRPKEMSPLAFAFQPGRGGDYSFSVPGIDVRKFRWITDGSGWGHMELVPLTERLGSYFGTDEGLLVVRAPEDESLKLEDGDVIQSIDGREPKSVSHAMRILGSYQGGEQLELQIMRDKRKQTLTIEMPENRHSSWVPQAVPGIKSDVVVVPKVRIRREDRT